MRRDEMRRDQMRREETRRKEKKRERMRREEKMLREIRRKEISCEVVWHRGTFETAASSMRNRVIKTFLCDHI